MKMDTDTFNHSFVFEFEKSFNEKEWNDWFQKNWTLSFWYSAFYIVIIFGGQYVMKNRERFELRPVLVLWSGLLAIFSIAGTVRSVPELMDILARGGLQHSVCYTRVFHGVTWTWSMLFTVSKVVELGDTVFIVLRKQRLIFLHWYHHVTVLIFVWLAFMEHSGPGRWFATVNYSVHAFMYSYYALRACRIRLPKFVNMTITTMQIVQMVIGLFICGYSYYLVSTGTKSCHLNKTTMCWGTLMYISYFVLFGNYFYHTYIKRTPADKPVGQKNGAAGDSSIVRNGVHDSQSNLRHRKAANGTSQ